MYNAFGTKVAEHIKLYTKVHKPENIYVNQPVNDKLLIIFMYTNNHHHQHHHCHCVIFNNNNN